ncbi:MAG: sulfite exporter TauE/SafE family protein [Sedimentisphaerales bacterium]|nr:sulfite exporter TauE/SafE family protein [Sedimentisphaerales bacterium]
MPELSSISWAVVIACAVMIGFSKTGIPGAGILVAPLMAMVMPAKESTGFVLPMLAVADIMAIIYWRRHVAWANLLRLLPWTMVGVIVGYLIMGKITNEQLMPIIGVIVLALITVTWWRNRKPDQKNVPTYWWFAGGIGILAGSTSMMANAAGPVMIIYLLAMKSEKKEFVGTAAWFFWILNLTKMPFSSKLGLISQQSLTTNLTMIPCLILGGLLGIYLVHRIPQGPFNALVKILAVLAAVILCVKHWL